MPWTNLVICFKFLWQKYGSQMHNLESHFSNFFWGEGHPLGPPLVCRRFKFLWQKKALKRTIQSPIFPNFPGGMPLDPLQYVDVLRFYGQKMALRCIIQSPFFQNFLERAGMPEQLQYDVLSFYGKNSSKIHNLKAIFFHFPGDMPPEPLV